MLLVVFHARFLPCFFGVTPIRAEFGGKGWVDGKFS
jgi:hypothetical protein